MGTPNRTSYVANIKTTLEAIQAGDTPAGSSNAFVTTIASVTVRTKHTPQQIHPTELPQIQIWMLNDANERTWPSRSITIVQDIDLFVILRGDDEEATNDDIDNVREDIIAALYADPKRGGFADDTIYIGGFEGLHPDLLIGQIRMQWRIRLLRRISRQ